MTPDRLGRLGRTEIKAAARRFERTMRQMTKRSSTQERYRCCATSDPNQFGFHVFGDAQIVTAQPQQTAGARLSACVARGGSDRGRRGSSRATTRKSGPLSIPADSTMSGTDPSGKVLSHDSLTRRSDAKP